MILLLPVIGPILRLIGKFAWLKSGVWKEVLTDFAIELLDICYYSVLHRIGTYVLPHS